jgi:hypothetical protein
MSLPVLAAAITPSFEVRGGVWLQQLADQLPPRSLATVTKFVRSPDKSVAASSAATVEIRFGLANSAPAGEPNGGDCTNCRYVIDAA